jgi:hypothetical protein
MQQSFLGNGSVNRHERNNCTATKGLCFLCGLCRDVISKARQELVDPSRVEAGSNTSTVALRVVGGDEMGSLESETVQYGHESHGTRTRKRLC